MEFDAKINGPRASRSKGKAKPVASTSEGADDGGDDESDEPSAKPKRVRQSNPTCLSGADGRFVPIADVEQEHIGLLGRSELRLKPRLTY